MGTAAVMFCGGRGANSITRGFLNRRDIDLSLVINGYDNGLSTGALRRLIPGMLGPSDFRKNIMLRANPALPSDTAIIEVLGHRFPVLSTLLDFDVVAQEITEGNKVFCTLPDGPRRAISTYLDTVRHEICENLPIFNFSDCSLGNLLIAGAFLWHDRDFNAAIEACSRLASSPVRVINVTNGENRYLVGLKSDGTVLVDETDIVGPQNCMPIVRLYLIPRPLPDDEVAGLRSLSMREKGSFLADISAEVSLSAVAHDAISGADLIVYGPGTPHSSLLPSYLTPGIGATVRASRARAKVFVVNMRQDHDVQGLNPAQLVDLTLKYLGDPKNKGPSISHVLCHELYSKGFERAIINDITWIMTDLAEPGERGVHNGSLTASALMDIVRELGLRC